MLQHRTHRRSRFAWAAMVAVVAGLMVTQCAPAPTTTAPSDQAPVATEAPAAAEKITLRVWWWGEQEAPGLQKWLEESGDLYTQQHPNVSFEFTLVENTTMYPNFLAAAAAGNPPDLEVLWGGALGLEQAWNGNIRPISDFWTEEQLSHIYCPTRAEGYWDGKQYLIPLYIDSWLMEYNKDVFRKSGLDPEKPPETWDEFVSALEKIKAAGFEPFPIGTKDGAVGSWFPSLFGTGKMDSITDLHKAVIGEANLTDDKYSYWWGLEQELLDKGLINDDATSITLGEALDRFLGGNVGIVMNVQPAITYAVKVLGVDTVGVMLPPKTGDGKLGTLMPVPGTDLAIPTKAAHPEEAADFLLFLNSPERIAAQYMTSGSFSSSDQLDVSIITSPQDKLVAQWIKERPGPAYNFNYPGDFETGLYSINQEFLSGAITTVEAAQEYEDVASKWREQNPEALEYFKTWAANPLVCP